MEPIKQNPTRRDVLAWGCGIAAVTLAPQTALASRRTSTQRKRIMKLIARKARSLGDFLLRSLVALFCASRKSLSIKGSLSGPAENFIRHCVWTSGASYYYIERVFFRIWFVQSIKICLASSALFVLKLFLFCLPFSHLSKRCWRVKSRKVSRDLRIQVVLTP